MRLLKQLQTLLQLGIAGKDVQNGVLQSNPKNDALIRPDDLVAFCHVCTKLGSGRQGLNSQVRPNATCRRVVDVVEINMACNSTSSVCAFYPLNRPTRFLD